MKLKGQQEIKTFSGKNGNKFETLFKTEIVRLDRKNSLVFFSSGGAEVLMIF